MNDDVIVAIFVVMLLSSDSVTLIVQRFCPVAVDSPVSTDDPSPVFRRPRAG